MRRALVLLALLLVPGVGATAGCATGAARGSEPACTGDRLAVSVRSAGDASGQSLYVVTFRDTGRDCVLRGFPRVEMTAAGGTRLGRPAAAIRDGTDRAVLLRSGGAVIATVFARDIGDDGRLVADAANGLPDDCRGTAAAAFRIAPPGVRRSTTVVLPHLRACRTGRPWMSVQAVHP